MIVAFLSSTLGNKGPSNVHRELVSHWPRKDKISLVKQSPKPIKIIDAVLKGMKADVVFSGDADWPELIACKILHLLGKPIVCFNHGYIPFENDVNELGLSQKRMRVYRRYLSEADAIIANSKYQMEFVAKEQPELRKKLSYVNNAVDPFKQMEHQTGVSSIIRVAASGGARPIKNNVVVAQAIKLLNENGHCATLTIYGRNYSNNPKMDSLLSLPYIQVMGQVPHKQFLQDLQSIDVFVMNSIHEPFGLSALDAIQAGASVLLSKNCGVLGVLQARDNEIIQHEDDVNEVAQKIVSIFMNPNAKELYRSIDFCRLNWRNTAIQVRKIILSCNTTNLDIQ